MPDVAYNPQPVADYSAWRAEDYFQTYYSEVVLPDEQIVLRYQAAVLEAAARQFDHALEYGCGPTLHRAIAATPHVSALTMADWLPDNLEHVRRWLGSPASTDWNRFTEFVLRCEGREPTTAAIQVREGRARRVIGALSVSDARWRHPLGREGEGRFDLLVSGFCIDAVSGRKDVWRRCMRNVLSTLAPRGMLVLHALHRCRGYKVAERTFPGADLSVDDLRESLVANGFEPGSLDIQVVPTPDNAQYGYTGILVASGCKA